MPTFSDRCYTSAPQYCCNHVSLERFWSGTYLNTRNIQISPLQSSMTLMVYSLPHLLCFANENEMILELKIVIFQQEISPNILCIFRCADCTLCKNNQQFSNLSKQNEHTSCGSSNSVFCGFHWQQAINFCSIKRPGSFIDVTMSEASLISAHKRQNIDIFPTKLYIWPEFRR